MFEEDAQAREASDHGCLILNADDWGQERETTDRTLECFRQGSLSSVSSMVFMKDTERAAGLALEHGISAGLHLNLTARFTLPGLRTPVIEHQRKVAAFLRGHRYAQVLFHPGLMRSFEYLVAAQRDEFSRLYGAPPARWDGHHHMHLCSNVLFAGLLPEGTVVRRSYSFVSKEKSPVNRLYRDMVNRSLARRHRLTEFFFSLPVVQSSGMAAKIFALARTVAVEMETHPINPDEYRCLMSGDITRLNGGIPVASGFNLPPRSAGSNGEAS